MARTRIDTFEEWQKSGKWPELRNLIKKGVLADTTDIEICRRLHITQATFIGLKKKHPEIQEAIDEAMNELKDLLMGKMLELALGATKVTEQQVIIDNGSGKPQSRKVFKTSETLPPNANALEYLLSHKFGASFLSNYEQLKIAKEKIEANKEEWNNGESSGKDSD